MLKKILVGLLAGIVCGLFATGGGMIVVPALIHLFNLEDSKARATSVFAILPMVVTSGIFYYRNNYIDWKLGIMCAIGGIIGGYIGAKLLKKLSTNVLKIAFYMFSNICIFKNDNLEIQTIIYTIKIRRNYVKDFNRCNFRDSKWNWHGWRNNTNINIVSIYAE